VQETDTLDLPVAARPTLAPTAEATSDGEPDDGPLLVVDGRRPRCLALRGRGVVRVGRGGDVDVTLDDPTVSRRHAALEPQGAGWRVVDLGSQHGLLVDGARATSAALEGDHVLTLGASTLLFLPRLAGRPAPLRADGPELFAAAGATRALVAELEGIARTELPVLLLGETGVGKDVAARLVHATSRRARGPFIALNCAAVPEPLAEAELFGYERGAFSGAEQARAGVFEAADGGTLFLDELGELPPPIQAKLLRALESGTFQRLGDGARTRRADVRVVSATHAPLDASARFRRDLYYRVSGAPITVPPLRERPLDVVPLARAFLVDAARSFDAPSRRLAPDGLDALLEHGWPGNVRELRHVMGRLAARAARTTAPLPAITAREVRRATAGHARASLAPRATPTSVAPTSVAPKSARASVVAPGRPRALDAELRGLERARIVEALAATGGNRTRAAALIAMPRRTFLTKLKQHGIA
jgi:two-component system response regulator AtoC